MTSLMDCLVWRLSWMMCALAFSLSSCCKSLRQNNILSLFAFPLEEELFDGHSNGIVKFHFCIYSSRNYSNIQMLSRDVWWCCCMLLSNFFHSISSIYSSIPSSIYSSIPSFILFSNSFHPSFNRLSGWSFSIFIWILQISSLARGPLCVKFMLNTIDMFLESSSYVLELDFIITRKIINWKINNY